MAEGKKSFVLYSDQKELFEHLSDEQAGKLIKHIFKYVNDENPTCEDPIVNLAFITIKASLKRDLQKWEKQIEQRSAAGKKSAEKRKATSVNEKQRALTSVKSRARNSTDSVSVSVNDNVSDSVNDNVKRNNIEERKLKFASLVKEFDSQYSIEMLREFYSYWSEHSPQGVKMRFEKEKVFDINKRLINWHKRSDKFDKPKQEIDPLVKHVQETIQKYS